MVLTRCPGSSSKWKVPYHLVCVALLFRASQAGAGNESEQQVSGTRNALITGDDYDVGGGDELGLVILSRDRQYSGKQRESEKSTVASSSIHQLANKGLPTRILTLEEYLETQEREEANLRKLSTKIKDSTQSNKLRLTTDLEREESLEKTTNSPDAMKYFSTIASTNSSALSENQQTVNKVKVSNHSQSHTSHTSHSSGQKQQVGPKPIPQHWQVRSLLNVSQDYPLAYSQIICGYVWPLVALITLFTNLMIVFILSQRDMRSPTNTVLSAIAIADIIPILVPVPWFVYLFAMGNEKQVLYPPIKCYFYQHSTRSVSELFYFLSTWLNVLLAIQDYLTACWPNLAQKYCKNRVVVIEIVVLTLLAFLLNLPQALKLVFKPVRFYYNGQLTWGCKAHQAPWFKELVGEYVALYDDIFTAIIVLFVDGGPAIVLIALTALLVRQLKYQRVKGHLLMEQARTASKRRRERHRQQEVESSARVMIFVLLAFLAVKIPFATTYALMIIQSRFEIHFVENLVDFQKAITITDLVFVLSYPINFTIFCCCSKKFRHKCAQLLAECSSSSSSPLSRGGSSRRNSEGLDSFRSYAGSLASSGTDFMAKQRSRLRRKSSTGSLVPPPPPPPPLAALKAAEYYSRQLLVPPPHIVTTRCESLREEELEYGAEPNWEGLERARSMFKQRGGSVPSERTRTQRQKVGRSGLGSSSQSAGGSQSSGGGYLLEERRASGEQPGNFMLLPSSSKSAEEFKERQKQQARSFSLSQSKLLRLPSSTGRLADILLASLFIEDCTKTNNNNNNNLCPQSARNSLASSSASSINAAARRYLPDAPLASGVQQPQEARNSGTCEAQEEATYDNDADIEKREKELQTTKRRTKN